jgi:uncharacterized protein (DUF885 family)
MQTAKLDDLVERYWVESTALAPWYSWGGTDLEFATPAAENISPQGLADSFAIEQRYLAAVSGAARPALDAGSQLTYDLFRRERLLAVEGFTYPGELLPLNPFEGMLQEFALMAPGALRVASTSPTEYAQWRARTANFVRWTHQAIANLREGLRRGITLPRVLIEETLPQLTDLGADTPENLFYRAARAATAESGAATPMLVVLKNEVLPAYRELDDFLVREYLPRARTGIAWSALPLGEAWYAYLLKKSTDGTATPAQMHARGLAEVERLHARMQTFLNELGFQGDARNFYATLRREPRAEEAKAQPLFDAVTRIKAETAAALPLVLAETPRADFMVRPVEAFRVMSALPLSYRPRAPNGVSPSTLYLDIASLAQRPDPLLWSSYLQEAVPGRHTQLELQRERTDLPRFRRFGGPRTFVDGWSLYAVTLGEELGLYHDPEVRFGALLAQLECAAGLVLDTGIHAQGWTRPQAVAYLQGAVPIEERTAAILVDRAIALPGRAAACAVGLSTIQSLRAMSAQRRGAAFDLRSFHAALLEDGALPMDLLEEHIKAWLALPPPASLPGGVPALPSSARAAPLVPAANLE